MKIKRFLRNILNNLIIILALILSSCSKSNEYLEGNWAVFEMIYQGKDISKIDDSSGSYVTNSMIIKEDEILFVINTRPKKFISTTYEYFENGNDEYIEIHESDDPRFLGRYILKIEENKDYVRANTKEYNIELVSDEMYISGLKYVSNVL